MTWIDLMIVVVAGGAMASGFSSGLIRQAAGIVGFLLALALAVRGMDGVGAMLAASLGFSARIAPLAGFALVFIAVQVAVSVVAGVAEKIAGALKLGIVNRAGGALVGGLRALLVLSAVFVPLRFVGVPRPETRAASPLYEPVAGMLPVAWRVAGAAGIPGLAERFRHAINTARTDSTADARTDSLDAQRPDAAR